MRAPRSFPRAVFKFKSINPTRVPLSFSNIPPQRSIWPGHVGAPTTTELLKVNWPSLEAGRWISRCEHACTPVVPDRWTLFNAALRRSRFRNRDHVWLLPRPVTSMPAQARSSYVRSSCSFASCVTRTSIFRFQEVYDHILPLHRSVYTTSRQM